MAQIVIPVKDNELKAEIVASFVSSYANPEGLSGKDLVIKHVSNFVAGVLNQHRAVEAQKEAEKNVEIQNSLT